MGSLHTKKLELFSSWRLCPGTRKERARTFKTKPSHSYFMNMSTPCIIIVCMRLIVYKFTAKTVIQVSLFTLLLKTFACLLLPLPTTCMLCVFKKCHNLKISREYTCAFY